MEEVKDLLGLEDLAAFATKAVYASASTAKKLYEHTVEEARALVKVRDQNKVKKDGIQALGLNLGRNLLPLDKIKAKATRLVVADAQVEDITAAIMKHVEAGVFDAEIAVALETAEATAKKMAETANKKNEVDASVPVEGGDIDGLELEAVGAEPETGEGIETI